VLVVLSALSFARALQRLYEVAFRLPALGGVRGTPSTVLWVALIPVIWMPRAVAESADRYGLIGVAFAFVSWLVAAGFTLVGSAAAGAVIAERRAA
jgi:hypothetical protein